MKAEVGKLEINKFVKVSIGLNNLNSNVDDLHIYNLKTVLVDLKKISDVVFKEVLKKAVHKKLNTELNNLENKIPDTSTLI